jgi:hypothetical protein
MDTRQDRVRPFRRAPVACAAALVLASAVPSLAQAPMRAPASSVAANPQRDNVRLMEGVLTNAVKNGADNLGRQMQVADPGSIIVTGTARARGFALDGYGVFFVVEVPMMKQSVIWSAQASMREQRRDLLRQIIANTADGPERRQFENELRRMERTPAAPTQVAQPGVAVAQSVTDAAAVPSTSASAAAAAPMRDPNELYTEAVKTALIEAMLNFGASLVGPDEWLTVAAADSEGPQMPGQLYDASTIVLRVKGADLASYHAGKLTREELVKRVEIREF